MYPNDIDCLAYSERKLKIGNKLDKEVETNLLIFLKKYFHRDFEEQMWTEVDPDIFVYSAFIDTCPPNISPSLSLCAFFIGITFTNASNVRSLSSNLNCAVKRDYEIKYIGFASIEVLPENHSKAYSAAFFYCVLKEFGRDALWPEQATLFRTSISAWVPIKYLASKKLSSNIATSLCVRPLYGSYSSLSLSEFLAYYSIMGVKHFIFYHQNISEFQYAFLKFLKTTHFSIEVLLWDIPLNNSMIHEYGQIVFTQDCIARSKYKFSHTIIVDLDEFIVPKLHSSITDLILYLDREYKNAGSYTIPMVMFCEEFSYQQQYSLYPLFNANKRQKTPWAHGFRSKYILKPDRIHYAGIHFVWKYQGNWIEVKISDTIALLHHYRRCCGVLQSWFFHLFNFHVLKDNVVIDNTLINHVHKVMNHTLTSFILNLTSFSSNHFKAQTMYNIV